MVQEKKALDATTAAQCWRDFRGGDCQYLVAMLMHLQQPVIFSQRFTLSSFLSLCWNVEIRVFQLEVNQRGAGRCQKPAAAALRENIPPCLQPADNVAAASRPLGEMRCLWFAYFARLYV